MKDKSLKSRAVMLLFLCLFIISMSVTIYYYRQDTAQERAFVELEKSEDNDRDNVSYDGSGSTAPSLPILDNPDCVGWIKIEGTTISYPIMQHEGDSEYYLHRDYKGDYSFYGTPFLDINCTPESDNCIIYGHNINGRKMFGALHAYSDEKYYREHPDILVRFGDEIYEYHIVSVIQTNVTDKIYDFTDVGSQNEYRKYIKLILDESLYKTVMGEQIEKELEREFEDGSLDEFFEKYKFITLSTCRTWVGKDSRVLVIAMREVKMGNFNELYVRRYIKQVEMLMI